MIGKRFGRLIVLEKAEKAENGKTQYKCKCDCGNIAIVKRNSLVSNHTKSCGCLAKECKKTIALKHGKRNTRLYGIWLGMKDRCNNKKNKRFDNYGEKGIKVCEEWSSNFEKFYNWSCENGYSEELSIERIDIKKDYCPENCKWITMKEQARNKSTTKFQIINGKEYSLAEISREFGIKQSTVYSRYRRGKRNEELL